MADFLKLKKSNCKNCYKCIRCCPVKSIRFSGGQANIVGNECILCGQCFVSCPQNAKEITNSVEAVKVLIMSGEPVVASVAPSFIANYEGAGINTIENALIKLGLHSAEETAIGATIVKNEYQNMIDRDKRDVLITSSCHSVNLLIQKYYPKLLNSLAEIVSPMQAHAIDIKKRYPNAKVVFIGPCVAKKDEANYYEGIVDAALTFEELTQWMQSENISIDLNEPKESIEKSRARFFPTTGGIIKSIINKNENYTYIAVDGVDNCMKALDEIGQGKIAKCFVEMSACVGSCIGGPVMEKYRKKPLIDYMAVNKYAGSEDFEVEMLSSEFLRKNFVPIELKNSTPSEHELKKILTQLGKDSKEDELDCGSCGYNTCREKAAAVYYGKADLSMCLPSLYEKSESFSDTIVENSPNAIIVLNDELEVQKVNSAALELINIRNKSDVLGEPVVRILDPIDFMKVRTSGTSKKTERKYLAEYNKYVDENIIYDKQNKLLITIMRNVTQQALEHEKKETISKQTIETTNKVIEKQMRVVHEIASLLGETAAETKIALTKLKETISDD